MKKPKTTILDLTPEEMEQLAKTGRVKIDDPQRGEIEIRMRFEENHVGLIGKRFHFNVIRSGTALHEG